jgi:hypothetical protein
LTEAAALAAAARELLRAGLVADARPIVERLAAVLEAARWSRALVVDFAAAKAKR